MSSAQITNILIQNNSTPFLSQIVMSVTFDVIKQIKDVIYVGSPSDDKYDQILEQFSMGPFDQKGSMQFTIEANPPDYTNIPTKEDLLGVSAIILTASYQKKEFFRCGYYVYNCYTDPELIEKDTPQTPIDINKVQRNILSDKPRITRFDIQWDTDEETMQILQQQDFQNKNQMENQSFFEMLNQKEIQQNNNIFTSNGIFEELNNMPNFSSDTYQQEFCFNKF